MRVFVGGFICWVNGDGDRVNFGGSDMMQMRSGIQSEVEREGQKNQTSPLALLYGAVCGVSARRMQYTLPTVEDFVVSQKMHRLKRLNSSADVARAPLGFLAPAEAPGMSTAS